MRYSVYSLTSPLDRLYECFDCGSAVNNKTKHDEFHLALDQMVSSVSIVSELSRSRIDRTY